MNRIEITKLLGLFIIIKFIIKIMDSTNAHSLRFCDFARVLCRAKTQRRKIDIISLLILICH